MTRLKLLSLLEVAGAGQSGSFQEGCGRGVKQQLRPPPGQTVSCITLVGIGWRRQWQGHPYPGNPHGSWWMSNDSMDWGRETAPQHALTLLDNNINLNRNGAHEGDLAWQRDVWRLGGAFVGATRDDHTTNLRA